MGMKGLSLNDIATLEALGATVGPPAKILDVTCREPPRGPGVSWTTRIDDWIPWSDNQLNGAHWGKKNRMKKGTGEIVSLACFWIPSARGKRSVRVHIVLPPKKRAPDPTNLWKDLLDGLKRCGMLLDDSGKWCRAEPIEFSRGERLVTFITITEM
jgi:hypothetical protein